MWGAHKKCINIKKSFHPLTYKNLSAVEEKQAEKDAQSAAKDRRLATLMLEKEERRYDELQMGGTSIDAKNGLAGKAAKFRRAEWDLFDSAVMDGDAKNGVPTAASSDEISLAKPPLKNDGADEVKGQKRAREETVPVTKSTAGTGIVTAADAAAMRKQVDDERKARSDPLKGRREGASVFV